MTDVREIRLAQLDKTRPVLVLTRDAARPALTKVTVVPVTRTVKGLSSEVPLGPTNGLDAECAASLDNVVTVPTASLGRVVGWLHPRQERDLAVAMVRAFDLDLPVLGG
ncbi:MULTISPECIES: type II toxin-antitoxin system PemK/MazF family toxin [Kytococcus]|uniref:type II toxin-antitoxin system PemK/MazF family toxin n=1 Tax=Kytococcus TaxID=57499 RepID=UPI0022AA10D7|nr:MULTISPECIES: type II toxin-antitoxin system PemK/MazF family toxin [Kytococcus]